jgi:hypothetical protein
MADPIPAQMMPLFHPNVHRRVWENLPPEQQRRAVTLLAEIILQHLPAVARAKEVRDE